MTMTNPTEEPQSWPWPAELIGMTGPGCRDRAAGALQAAQALLSVRSAHPHDVERAVALTDVGRQWLELAQQIQTDEAVQAALKEMDR